MMERKAKSVIFKKSIIIIALLSLPVLCLTPPLHAKDEVRLGPIRINPFAEISQTYDTNIFLAASGNKIRDQITTISPGADISMTLKDVMGGNFDLKSTYSADFVEYWFNSEERRVDQNLKLAANLDLGRYLSLKCKEDLVRTAIPDGTELTGLQERIRNDVKCTLGFKREKLGLDVWYKNTRDQYIAAITNTYGVNAMGVSGSYEIFPKTSILAEFIYANTVWDKVAFRDSWYNDWELGIKYRFNHRLDLTIKGGFRYADYYKSQRVLDPWVGSVNLTYKLLKTTTLDISGQRTLMDSTSGVNNYFMYNRVDIKLRHHIWKNFFIAARGSYVYDGYSESTTDNGITAKRIDRIWIGGAGLTYQPSDYLTLNLDYQLAERISTFTNWCYTDNIIMFLIKAYI